MVGNSGTIIKTTDSGISWLPLISNANDNLKAVFFTNSDTGYICGDNGLIEKSINGGSNWNKQISWTENNLNSISFPKQKTGYIVGDAGKILKTLDGGGEPIGIQPISNEVPQQYILHQNYPNPFNPVTKIKFSIPPSKGARGMTVRLTIYDILGREIAVLVNEQLNPGVYEVEWNATGYSSGVYFYQLSINNEQLATKKMVLLK